MKQYFLDTSFVVALMDKKDVHHQRATGLYKKIHKQKLFLSDVLINETLSVFAKRCESRKKPHLFGELSSQFMEAIKHVPILCLYELVPKSCGVIVGLMRQSQGALNFHDCLIAYFLRDSNQVCLVTFDEDFRHLKNLNLIMK